MFEHRYFRLNSQEWAPYGVPACCVRKARRSSQSDASLAALPRTRSLAASPIIDRMPEFRVVIPTYNRLETLRHVIPSLLAQDLAPSATR